MSKKSVVYPKFAQIELTPDDMSYPGSLRELSDAPKKLYLIGSIEALNQPTIAIVGSRKASPYGLLCSARFAKRAACHGLVVVSGGAIGCDQAAHQGALETKSPTIVVLGCGADIVYPNDAHQLFASVLAAGGAIISELPWGSPPARWAFIKRNRIIAGLAQATLIVEAGMPSGTFSTADSTLALGRELLVLPGSILSKQSAGCNHLIAQGAWPIIDDRSFDDALSNIYTEPPLLRGFSEPQKRSGLSEAPDEMNQLEQTATADAYNNIMERLRVIPSFPDELVGTCGKDVVEVIRYLSALEFSGQVTRLIDGRFSAAFKNG